MVKGHCIAVIAEYSYDRYDRILHDCPIGLNDEVISIDIQKVKDPLHCDKKNCPGHIQLHATTHEQQLDWCQETYLVKTLLH